MLGHIDEKVNSQREELPAIIHLALQIDKSSDAECGPYRAVKQGSIVLSIEAVCLYTCRYLFLSSYTGDQPYWYGIFQCHLVFGGWGGVCCITVYYRPTASRVSVVSPTSYSCTSRLIFSATN
jgi:hypothetical protein